MALEAEYTWACGITEVLQVIAFTHNSQSFPDYQFTLIAPCSWFLPGKMTKEETNIHTWARGSEFVLQNPLKMAKNGFKISKIFLTPKKFLSPF